MVGEDGYGGLSVMGGVMMHGGTLGFGLGTSIGASVDFGVGSSATSGPQYEMGCMVATPVGGVGGSVAFDKSHGADGTLASGFDIGAHWGGRVGCTAMFVFGG